MSLNKKQTQIAASALALSLFLAGCGAGNTGGEQSGQDEQVLNISTESDMDTMDSTITTSNFTPINNVFEGLMTYDLDGKLVPGAAEAEPEVSEDGLTYTFQLREDANWSDGSPVTAEDFVFAWQRLADPDNAAGYAFLISGVIKNAEAIQNSEMEVEELGVQALDDKTLEVTLEKPTPYFLDILTLPPMMPQKQSFVEEQGENYGLSADTTLYNGPFTLQNWSAAEGGAWTYVKNEEYWDSDNVQLDEIEVTVVPETGTGINLYESGELDYIELTGNFVQEYQDNEDFNTRAQAWTYYVEMNQEVAELQNENIRKALNLSIDRESFTENVLQNGAEPVYGHVPTGFAQNPETGADFREEAGDLVSYDVAAAQEAWQQGLQELGIDSLTLELTASDTEDSKALSEFLQSEWQTNLPGLTIEIRQMPDNARLDNIKQGNYDLGAAYWLADFADPINFIERFHTDINRGNYSFEDIDALIEQSAEQYNDPEARWNTLVQAEQLAIGEHYVDIPVYQAAEAYLEKPYVNDVFRPTFGSTLYKFASVEETE